MIFIRVDTADEAEAVRKALKAGSLGLPFAITYPGGGGEYAEEPAPAAVPADLKPGDVLRLTASGEFGSWIEPVPDCPVTGWPQVDRDDADMCSCGHRHIRITAVGGGGPGRER